MYDVLVLGGGPGGSHAAKKAVEYGYSCAIAEQEHFGGVCLNEGCIPTKTLLHSAKLFEHATESSEFGVTVQNASFDLSQAVSRKDSIVKKLRKANESGVKKSGADIFHGTGTIESYSKEKITARVNETVIEAKNCIVCTGSDAIRLPIPGADLEYVGTNREILSLKELPEKMVVIGGGIIGLEFASLFSAIGSQVHVIEMLPSIGGQMDPEIVSTLQKQMQKKGVTFHLNAKVEKIEDHNVFYTDENGKKDHVGADYVLMSVGRRPRGKEAGLDALPLQCEKNAIVADEYGRTNLPNIYVVGDVNGKSMLAHTATREADACVDALRGVKTRVNYDTIPQVIYTHPEVASVGLSKQEAENRGYDVVTSTLPMTYSGRYMAEAERGRGFVKVVADREYGTVLGIHMIDGNCSELLYSACVIVEAQLRVQDVKDIVCAHPTISEIIKDAIESLKI